MFRSQRRSVFFLLAGLVPLGGCERTKTAAVAKLPPDAPNVLLITIDTTRADRLGCYGYVKAQTPALDALAGAGVRFEHAFCQVPLTLASHASLLTSTYPPTNGLRFNSSGVLPADLPTVAEAFHAQGYRTGGIIAAWVLNSAFGLNRGFDRYDDQLGEPGAAVIVQERTADKVCEVALAWLNEQADRPFFAWVHFFDPHFPYNPPAPFNERLADRYDGEIAFMDSQIQRLLDWLDAHNCRARTLVVVAGDHGEAFGEHGEIEHGLLIYNVTVHVPLIFSWPGRLPQGKAVSAGVPLVDVVPTIVDLMGWKAAPTMQGESLRAAFEADSFAFRPVYCETEYPRVAYAWAPLRSYTTEQWRYIEAPRPELYDRSADPAETNNVIAEHGDVAAQMRGALEEALAGMPEHEAGSVVLDDRARQALASLGYVGVGTAPPNRNAAARDPKDMVAVARGLLAAQQLSIEKRYADVIQIMEPLVQQSPESDELFTLLGEAYAQVGRFDEAVTALRASLRAVPANPNKLCQLGQALARIGKPDEALDCYQKAIVAQPDNATAYNEMGVIYFQRKQLAKAQELLRRCVEINPTWPNGLTNLGSVLSELGHKEEAVKYLRKSLEHDPANEPTHRLLWQVLMSMRRPPEAVAALRAACKALPADLGLQRTLAGLLASMPQAGPAAVQEAIGIARVCCNQEPANPENFDVLGIACAAAGDFANAVNAARQAMLLAQSQNRADFASQIAQRLQGYESRLPK